MKFCSECGHAVAEQWRSEEQRTRLVCVNCHVVHYKNPSLLVACLVNCQDKLLLCRRAQEPAIGQWGPPSGFLECDESLQAGAARETAEETGVVIDPASLILYAVLSISKINQVQVVFRCQLEPPPVLKCGLECSNVAFMSEEEIANIDVAWNDSLGDAITQFFEEYRSGRFNIHLATIDLSATIQFHAVRYAINGGT